MNRQTHYNEAQYRYRQAVAAIKVGDLNGAGEFIWITVVHAVSAADPDHESHSLDAFGNPHTAPNNKRTYLQATGRIKDLSMSESDYKHCLQVTQQVLHNNAYHLRHSPATIAPYIKAGMHYASILMQIAYRATTTP